MNLKSIIDVLEVLRNSWEKKNGVFLAIVILIPIYFKLFSNLILPIFIGYEWVVKVVIPLLLVIILIITWLINTNRIIIRKNKKFVLGLIMKVDEDEAEFKIKRIVKTCTKEINSEFTDIEVKVFPINFKKNNAQIEKYLKNRSSSIDAFLFANIESGKEKVVERVEEKILIKDFSFIGNFDVNENRQIFKSTVNLANDLSIRHFYKDWAYIENNSFNDKRKIKYNFRDTILHYSGIYLIYLSEFKLSLEILKDLFNVKLSEIPKPVNGKIIILKENFAAGRLNNIVLNLFFYTAINTYWDTNNSQEAYRLLKECETIFPTHTNSYYHYISLARFAYENGSLEEAKDYTNKAKNRNGETIEVLINLAFLAIIESNIYLTAKYYKRIKNKPTKETKDLNVADIIDFLEKQRDVFTEKAELFDFAIAFLNKLFLDFTLGQTLLLDFIKKNNNSEELNPLINLASETTLIGKDTILKSRTNISRKKKKHKQKRKRQ